MFAHHETSMCRGFFLFGFFWLLFFGVFFVVCLGFLLLFVLGLLLLFLGLFVCLFGGFVCLFCLFLFYMRVIQGLNSIPHTNDFPLVHRNNIKWR